MAAVTFCEEGRAAMEVALTETAAAYTTNTAFDGVAIHDLDSWQTLKPWATPARNGYVRSLAYAAFG